jgi:hypothetical protein
VDADARIRTAASIPVETVIIDRADVPMYLMVAAEAKHLRELGMSERAIARALGVSDKTVAKAAAAVDVHVPELLGPEGQSDDQASPLRPDRIRAATTDHGQTIHYCPKRLRRTRERRDTGRSSP